MKKPESLIKKYPKIFAQHKLPMTQTCMCWGLECGDGWYDIIDRLCRHLQFHTDKNGYPQVEAVQVKEKFGTLRFYYDIKPVKEQDSWFERHCGVIEGLISATESLSAYTCEYCGTNQGVKQTTGWIVTLCPKCMKAYNERKT